MTNSREVHSVLHPDRPCHPCILCHKGNQSRYFHPKTLKDPSILEFLQTYEPDLAIKADSCICRSCKNELIKVKGSDIIPRWRKAIIHKTNENCCIPLCLSVENITKCVTNKLKVLQYFEDTQLHVGAHSTSCESDIQEDVYLCRPHYHAWEVRH